MYIWNSCFTKTNSWRDFVQSDVDKWRSHYSDVIMGTMASQITNLTFVYSTAYSRADQRKHQSSASLALVRGIHRWPVNYPHKAPVTRKMFPFNDIIMTKVTYGIFALLLAWTSCSANSAWVADDLTGHDTQVTTLLQSQVGSSQTSTGGDICW